MKNDLPVGFPEIVCLCGSTRFVDFYMSEGQRLALERKIVLTIAIVKYGGSHLAEQIGPEACALLDELHLRKIDLADRVHVLNIGGYIGESTQAEIAYAARTGKPITFYEPPVLPQ